MKHEAIDYQDCLDLGFKHIHLGDELFLKQYGYDWFTVDLRVAKQFYFTWDCDTRLTWLIRGGKKNIKNKLPIYNLTHLKQMVSFFTEKHQPQRNNPEPEDYPTNNIPLIA